MINNKLIREYKEYIHAHTHVTEGYLKSDKTISVNLHKFESKEKNILLIIGVTGSGKTTLAEVLSQKYKTKWNSTDQTWVRIAQKDFKDVKQNTEIKDKINLRTSIETIKRIKNPERLIIEGIDLIDIYKKPNNRKLILNQPMILIGLSSLRAGIRAGYRNMKREGGEGWKELYWMVKINMKDIQSYLTLIRKDVIKLPNVVIKKYKI